MLEKKIHTGLNYRLAEMLISLFLGGVGEKDGWYTGRPEFHQLSSLLYQHRYISSYQVTC